MLDLIIVRKRKEKKKGGQKDLMTPVCFQVIRTNKMLKDLLNKSVDDEMINSGVNNTVAYIIFVSYFLNTNCTL